MKKTAFFLAMMMAGSVFAGSISRGGASFSRPASPSPARSIGAVRPNVKPAPAPAPAPAAARPTYSSSPAATARPAPSPAPSYAAAPAAPAPAAAPSHAGTFASSFGGSFLGSMLGNSLAGNHGASNVTVNNGGSAPPAAPAAAGGAAPAASYVSAPAPGPSLFDQLLSVLGWVAVLAGLAALTWLLVKVIKEWRAERNPGRQAAGSYATANSGAFSPVERFLAIQTAFAGKDVPTLTSLLGPDLVGQMLADLPKTPTTHQLSNISFQVLEKSPAVISIHYTADDNMDDTKLDEVWHYENVRGLWLLNGINAFEDA